MSKRYGDPWERFLGHITVSARGCWIFDGHMSRNGYGRFYFSGAYVQAHRFAYEQIVETVRGGMVLDHVCRERACANPWHLAPVTPPENTRLGIGPTAINSAKRTCCNGHPFDEENTYLDRRGWRVCRACRRIRRKLAQ